MTSTPLLQVTGLTKTFGGLVAVDRLSFSVQRGEVVGLLGPNGSGKTTCLNLISGALAPTAGAVQLNGHDITGQAAHQVARAGVARTFQLVRTLRSLSALENVMTGAVFGPPRASLSVARAKAAALLTRVGLGGRHHEHPDAMTYIDQKRVELARALAANPHVLLLDEWLAGLNPTELQTGMALIRSLQEEGRTVLMVEHVMDAIRGLCSHCVVMSAGAKLAEGTPGEVLSHPDVVEAYLGGDPESAHA